LKGKIHSILEFIPDPAFILNENREICAWNTGMEHLTGVNAEDILGKASYSRAFPFFGTSRPVLIDLIDTSDEDLEKLYPIMAGVHIHREGGFLTAETYVPTQNAKHGIRLWVKAGLLLDENGNRIGAIEIFRNITQHRNIEKYLSTLSLVPGHSVQSVPESLMPVSEPQGSACHNQDILSYQYLSGALKHAGDYLAILDLSGRCIWANDALIASTLTGPTSDLIGTSLARLVAPEFRKTALDCLNIVRKEGFSRINIMLISANGRIPVEVQFSGVKDERDQLLGYLAIARAGKKELENVGKKEKNKISKV
ncbi:MAG: PAS domain-containing protein, partial [Methanoregula sp.]|nr:PAS domain-containing protein [Methanoregula sp.]